MSAWIVSKSHIDYMIRAAKYAAYASHHSLTYGADRELNVLTAADEIGRALWHENYLSVAYRYQDSDTTREYGLPGPSGFDHESITTYRYRPAHADIDIPTALKSVFCYEYQSCEHPGWHDSDAKAFCELLTRALICSLPGYDAAPWGIDDPAPDPCACGAKPERGDKYCGECGTALGLAYLPIR